MIGKFRQVQSCLGLLRARWSSIGEVKPGEIRISHVRKGYDRLDQVSCG
jgi:hypothetical protein